MAHDVFISYSSKDKNTADAVCAKLESQKIRCWIAPRDVPPGQSWAASIIEALSGSKVFVLVFSDGSNKSKQVVREVGEAVDNSIPIIPLRIEDVEPSKEMRYYIKSIHWLDAMTPPLEKHLQKLTNSVKALLSAEAGEIPPEAGEVPLEVALPVIEPPAKKRWPLPIWATVGLILVAVVIVSGIGWFAFSQPTVTPTPSEVPSTEIAIVSKPTDTPVPDTPTIAPTEIPSSVFRDDFDNALAEGWNILREVPSHWSLTDNPGSWRVTLIPGTVDGFIPEFPTNVLLREAPKGDFEIATLVHFTPTNNYQFAGLFVYQDDQNVMQLGRSFCDRADICVGNGIYFDSYGDVIENIAMATTNPSLAYLRLRREGTTYTGYYSEDGESWTTIGQHVSNINPAQVGLMAGQALEVETNADFEYFTMEELPSTTSGWSGWRTLTFNIPSETLWRQSGENSYTAVEQYEVTAFLWSNEIVEGDLILTYEILVPDEHGEGGVIIYGDGADYTQGSLLFFIGGGFNRIEKHTPFHEGENWLAVNEGNKLIPNQTYTIIVEIIGDEASLYIDGEKVASSFFTTEIVRRGRVGFTKFWSCPIVTYSNIMIKTSSSGE